MTETQNQKSEIMNIDMHDTPLHKWERELNEAQKRGDEYGQKYAKTMLEREQLKADVELFKSQLVKSNRDCLDARAEARDTTATDNCVKLIEKLGEVAAERDQLKAELLDVKTQLEFIRTWASKTHDELQHQSQLRQQWHEMARELAAELEFGPVAGCNPSALARFNAMEGEAK